MGIEAKGEVKGFVTFQPVAKPYELDWEKVNSFTDVVMLLKLLTGARDQKVHLYLYDEQVETYKHLFKNTEEEKETTNND